MTCQKNLRTSLIKVLEQEQKFKGCEALISELKNTSEGKNSTVNSDKVVIIITFNRISRVFIFVCI